LDEILLWLVIEAERTLVLIRHGQTDWNVEERFQGQLDTAMNAVGRRQAADVKRYLAGTMFDKVYSSPLCRAFETARLIVGDSPIIPDRRLSEIHHGLWQGRTKNEIHRRWPDQWKRWQEQPHFIPRDGEPAGVVRLRVEDFLMSMQGTNILCVSHGVIIQNVLSVLLGGSYGADVPRNGSVHIFYFRKKDVCRVGEAQVSR
jgi:broad specificity phosphatase PhoE